MEEKINLNDKEYIIKEIKYVEGLTLIDLPKSEQAKKLIILSCNMSEEELSNLSFKDGLTLQKIVNRVNDFGDFQNPVEAGEK